jgi:hypothetical protein
MYKLHNKHRNSHKDLKENKMITSFTISGNLTTNKTKDLKYINIGTIDDPKIMVSGTVAVDAGYNRETKKPIREFYNFISLSKQVIRTLK